MSFPQTRLTLIERLAGGGSEEDWQLFLKDYWGPICRFSLRWGAANLDDAEDVASQTFEVLWENRLLVRWVSNRSAKLRTLLCGVVRRILANRHRVRTSRERLAREMAASIKDLDGTHDEQAEAFYVAWVEDLVQQSVESLAADYYAQGKGDYLRVLYGRLCERMTIAEALGINSASVDNYFRHARRRLEEQLNERVRRHVEHYCSTKEAEEEFTIEWGRLGDYLKQHGGLEEAVGRAYELIDPAAAKEHHGAALNKAVTRLTTIIRSPGDATS